MKTLIAIPARYGSTRFPGKPLAKIAGKEMLLRVWENAQKTAAKFEDCHAVVYAVKEGKNPAEMSEDALTDVGRHVIDLWNEKAIVPDGWKVSPEDCIHAWMKFGEKVFKNFHGENIMVVSSNGVIRFAPYLTGDFNGFAGEHDIKVTTGGVCVFEREDDEENWRCTEWNVKPKKYFESLPD